MGVRRPDGALAWISVSSGPIPGPDGQPAAVVTTFVDVTERRRTEEALQESEARFRAMRERHGAVMLPVEPESGRIIDANEAAARFHGYARPVLRSTGIGDLDTLPGAEIAAERMQALDEKRSVFVLPHRLASGEERNIEVHSSPIEYLGNRVLFSVIHDVTVGRQAEKLSRRRRSSSGPSSTVPRSERRSRRPRAGS